MQWMVTLSILLSATLAMPATAQTVSPVPTIATPPPPPPPPCRRVGDDPAIRIDPDALARMAQIGLDRAGVFERMHETSIPETTGCWADPVGNFDSQLISVGMAQWNFGTGSLQPVLAAWRSQFRHKRDFKWARDALAPTYGKLLFSKPCLAVPVADTCRAAILAAEDDKGKLNAVLAAELIALFEGDAMLQVQTDTYIALLDKVRLDLLRVFAGEPITARKVRWAIDVRVQQGFLPPDEDVARLRAKLAVLPGAERAPKLQAIVDWYGALARTIDEDGIARDWRWNVAQWTCLIDAGQVDDEQYELMSLTFLRSRAAIGNSGRWQALAFERRAKIVLGLGSVSGVRDGVCAAPAAS
ncbi:hypothetical protein [Sphingomonas sp.]|jgi:hypothetical protein|uniref:hypothetical protein n=1 Tax=Sphingomonas sp. TaxID=28214 RepID=UPI002E353247|nr:hypothetical protein [Sphingomonas sp.]HEX4695872.1 hypothetical protein [Sphingomonas sp.]